jgi:fatty-acyl-CoA synthase
VDESGGQVMCGFGGLGLLEVLEYGSTRHAAATVTTLRDGVAQVATFSEVAARARMLSRALAAAGVRPGDVLATACRNHQEHLELLFASHLLGTCFVPLNNRVDDSSLKSMLATVSPRVLIADQETTARLGAEIVPKDTLRVAVGAAPGWLSYSELLAQGGDAEDRPLAVADEQERAMVLFTGGTTGEPKGACYSLRSLYLHTMALSSKLGFPLVPGDKALVLVPLFHGLGWQLPHLCWLNGVDLVFIDGSLPGRDVVAALEATRATFSAAVPSVWHDVVAFAGSSGVTRLGRLRKVVLGGAAIPPTLPARLQELGVATYISWGMTETLPSTLSLVASPHAGDPVEPDVRTTRPIPGVAVRAVDEDGATTDGPGQLEIRAPWITGEYVGHESRAGQWFATGDVGLVGETGQFTILGRAKEMIKSGGEAIWPAAIEAELLRHPDVLEAAVIGIPHERWGEQPLACVVGRGAATPEQLRMFLLESLPKWQVPAAWALESALPQTAAGKVDKRRLAELVATGSLVLVRV